jgi:hypothetical protein
MLSIGGVVYLGGGLLLATRLVSHRAAARPGAPPRGARA